jgi:hypothetical protein
MYSSRNREILQASRERNHMRDTKRDDLRCSTSPGNAMSDPYCVQSVCSSNISDASRGQQDPIGLKQQPEYCVRIARCSYFEQGQQLANTEKNIENPCCSLALCFHLISNRRRFSVITSYHGGCVSTGQCRSVLSLMGGLGSRSGRHHTTVIWSMVTVDEPRIESF